MNVSAPDLAALGSYVVGYEPMDESHREISALVEGLGTAADQGERLLALHELLLRHCADEERWMRESAYPEAAAHQREHEMLLEVVAEVRRRFDSGDAEAVDRLARQMPLWLVRHGESMDTGLAAHLRGAGIVAARRPAQDRPYLAG
jgi:hemerythrin-like metal-binding protein